MRYRIWGIKRTQLIAASLIPFLIWTFFRRYDQLQLSFHSLYSLYRPWLWWCLPLYGIAFFAWIFLVRRGVFSARYGFYAAAVGGLAYEFELSVSNRDFARVGLGIVAFLALFGVYRWLETQIECAHFNPRIWWYEGHPKSLPLIDAKVKFGETWYSASVRRCDRHGFFLLFDDAFQEEALAYLKPQARVEFELHFRQKVADGEAKIMARFADRGLGLQFLPKDLYHFSQYTALIEGLKGEGYASS